MSAGAKRSNDLSPEPLAYAPSPSVTETERGFALSIPTTVVVRPSMCTCGTSGATVSTAA